jgi:site-specific DNA-methyltransferase (adenine-specific)
MELMKEYPDGYFDLAIVDPPYGIGIGNMSYVKSGAVKTGEARRTDFSRSSTSWDAAIPSEEYFTELRRVSKNQIIWGGNYFIQYLRNTSCCLIWDKDNGTTDFADCEIAWTSFNSPVRKFKFRWNGMLQEDMKNKEHRIHPTQKPKQLYRWILDNYAQQGDKILDTHLGSGSIAIACHDLGFDLIACEIDLDYYEAACKRFAEQTAQQKLFA